MGRDGDRMEKISGVTIVEIVLVLFLIAVLVCVGSPCLSDWVRTSSCRKAARDVSGVLREARSLAISGNVEYEVDFDLDGNCFRLRRGNLAANSTAWSHVTTWNPFPPGILIASGAECGKVSDGDPGTSQVATFQFNPNGTGGYKGTAMSAYICILESDGVPRFRCGLWSTTTGRIVIHRRKADGSGWR